MFIKVRFSGHDRSKPFWVDHGDLRVAYRQVQDFIAKYIDPKIKKHRDLHRGRINYSDICTYQKKHFQLDGWTIERHGYRLCRTIRKVYNKKASDWARKGIYAVPGIRIIKTDNSLKDSSGINPISNEELHKMILENVYGTFFQNSIMYAKHEQKLNINLHAQLSDGPVTNISAQQFLSLIDMYATLATKRENNIKNISRLIGNSIFGTVINYLTPGFLYSTPVLEESIGSYKFQLIPSSGEFLEEGTVSITTKNNDGLIELLKRCLNESSFDKENLTVDITFIPAI